MVSDTAVTGEEPAGGWRGQGTHEAASHRESDSLTFTGLL